MRILLGAVSAIALMTAGAQAQVFNFSPADGGLSGAFGGGGLVASVLSAEGSNPDAAPYGAFIDFTDGHSAYADDTTPAGGFGSVDGVSGAAGGSENVALHIQYGTDNTGLIYQDSENESPDNGAVLLQIGDGNAGVILQYNDWNDAAAVQDGDDNKVVIKQSLESTFEDPAGPGSLNEGRSDHAAAAYQRGDNNIGLIDQGGNSNAAALVAAGDGNQQFIIQDSFAEINVKQNMAIAVAEGNNNIAFINQNTDDSPDGMTKLIDELYGNGESSDAIQIDANAETIVQHPLNLPLIGSGDAGSNKAGVFQTGDGNRSVTFQNGTGNNSTVIQHNL